MTHKEIAEIIRRGQEDELQSLADELDPPRPEPGTVVRFVSGDYGIASKTGVATVSNDGHPDFIPWEDVPILKNQPARILADDEVAVKIPPVSDWPDRATAIQTCYSERALNLKNIQRVITRAEAEAREAGR